MNHEKSITKSSKKSHESITATESAPAPSAAVTPPTPVATATPPTTPPGDMPPAVGAPATPKGWKARPAKGRGKTRGQKLKKDQITNQAAAAGEITNSTTYVADFGSRVPSQATLGFLMSNADAWRKTWEGANQFAAYAAEQRAAWEESAQGEMANLKPAFEFVTSREPAVAAKYTATTKYLGATNAIAKRAASTRKENDKAKAKKAGAGSTPAATPATQPAAKTLN